MDLPSLETIFIGITAIAAVIAIYFNTKQSYITNMSTKLAMKAYVLPGYAEIRVRNDDLSKSVFRIRLKNFGKTPALKLCVDYGEVVVDGVPETPPEVRTHRFITDQTLAQDQESYLQSDFKHNKFGVDIEEIVESNKILLACAKLSYEDVFGDVVEEEIYFISTGDECNKIEDGVSFTSMLLVRLGAVSE